MNYQFIKAKLTPRRIILLLVCLGAFIVYGENFGYPFKVTDPADPRFRVEQFDFADYRGDRKALEHAFRVLFPVGTEKAFIDKVLLEYGKSQSYRLQNKNVWKYVPRPYVLHYILMLPRGPSYAYRFDSKDRLKNIKMYGSYDLYPASSETIKR
ncbi:MAG: hypothetical protein V4621_02430 [Pseudomonadota bacterium]